MAHCRRLHTSDGHQTMFNEKRRVVAEMHHIYFTSEDNNIQKHLFLLSSWWWITCNEQMLLKYLQSWACVFFIYTTVIVSHNFSYFTVSFFDRMGANFDLNVYTIARENSCKIGRAPFVVLLISYNAVRAPYDFVRCPDDYKIHRWCANRWNRTISVSFVTIVLICIHVTKMFAFYAIINLI